MEEAELDSIYKNQNVRGRQDLKKGRSLILFTIRNIIDRTNATLIYPSVCSKQELYVSAVWNALSCLNVKPFLQVNEEVW